MNKKLWHRLSIAAALFMSNFSAAQAEVFNTFPDLEKNPRAFSYFLNRQRLGDLIAHGAATDRTLGLHVECVSKYQITEPKMNIKKPIDFSEGEVHPVKGEWIVNYRLERCGEKKIYNVTFTASPDGKPPSSKSNFPGVTIASDLLINDALMSTIVAAKLKLGARDCSDIRIFDMQVFDMSAAKPQSNNSIKGSWGEVWTFRMCGKLVEIPIIFTHNEKTGGTNFVVGGGLPKGP